MEVILKQDISGLGYKNDVVKVKDGYGRNYLIPNGIAIVANDSSKKEIEELLKQQSLKMAKIKAEAEKQAKKAESLDLKIHVKVGKNDKIYGSVTTVQILEELKKNNIEVDKKLISMDENIKKLGKYTAKIELHRDVKMDLKFEVVSE